VLGEVLKTGLSDRGHLIQGDILNIAAFMTRTRVQPIVVRGTMGRIHSQDLEERQWVPFKDPEDIQGLRGEAAQPRELARKGRTAKEKDD